MIKKYLIVILGSLFYCYEFFLRVSPSAISDILMQHFMVSATGFSVMSSAFFYAYMPMQMYSGILGDKYGVRKVLTLCVGLCVCATVIFVVSSNIYLATLARFLMGLSASFAYVGPLILASAWLEKKYYAASAGLIQIMGSFGAYLVSSDIGSRLLTESWQNTYYLLAAIGLLLMILIWVFIRNKPEVLIIDTSSSNISVLKALKTILGNRQTWFVALIGFAFWAPMSVFGELWGVSFLEKSEHVSSIIANSQMKYLWFGVATGGPVWGYLSSKGRKQVTNTAFLLAFSASTCLLYLDHLSIFIMNILLFAFGFAGSAQCISFGYMHDLHDAKLLGTALGFNNMFVILGGTFLQPLSGMLMDYFSHGNHDMYLIAMRQSFIMLPVISLFGIFVLNYFVENRK